MAELTLSAADIAAAILRNLMATSHRSRLAPLVVIEVGDGIARVAGLPDAAVNELLEFPGGVLGRSQP